MEKWLVVVWTENELCVKVYYLLFFFTVSRVFIVKIYVCMCVYFLWKIHEIGFCIRKTLALVRVINFYEKVDNAVCAHCSVVFYVALKYWRIALGIFRKSFVLHLKNKFYINALYRQNYICIYNRV